MKRATILVSIIALLFAACASSAGISTPQQAQKALTEAQATRVAVRDAIAKSYVTAQQNFSASPNDPAAIKLWNQAQAARTAFNRVDPEFTSAWQIAADAVDAWLKVPPNQADAFLSAKTQFDAVFASVTKSLTGLTVASSGVSK